MSEPYLKEVNGGGGGVGWCWRERERGEGEGRGEGQLSPDVATSLRPLTDWAPGFRLNLWPAAAAAAAEVAGRRGTFDPLLIPPL